MAKLFKLYIKVVPMVKKKAPTLEEIKKLLDYDCPQGNGLNI